MKPATRALILWLGIPILMVIPVFLVETWSEKTYQNLDEKIKSFGFLFGSITAWLCLVILIIVSTKKKSQKAIDLESKYKLQPNSTLEFNGIQYPVYEDKNTGETFSTDGRLVNSHNTDLDILILMEIKSQIHTVKE